MTGLGTAADAATGAFAYYDGGLGAQTPVIVSILQLSLAIAVYVWVALALTALFRKAGRPAWKAWVPVVNAWTLFTLGGMGGWWAVVLAVGGLIAGVGSVVVVALFAGAAIGAANDGQGGAAGAAVIGAVIVPTLIWVVYAVLVLVLQIRLMLRVNRGFGLGGGYTVLGILLFPVWASVVGWGSARWLGLAPTIAQPNLTAPPAPPAASPFTLGAVSAPFEGTTPPASAARPSPFPAGTDAAAPAVPPPPPPVGGNPWAPPPPPGAAPTVAPVSTPAAAVTPAPAPVAPAAAAPAAAPVAPVAPAAAPVAAAPPIAAPVPAVAPATPAPAAAGGAVDDLDERTVLAARRLGGWSLVLPGGTSVALTGDAAVLGRNPVATGERTGAQVIAVDDATRTVSKTHAALERRGDGWVVIDLSSTNGVFLDDDSEVAGSAEVSGVFFLGDARLELRADS